MPKLIIHELDPHADVDERDSQFLQFLDDRTLHVAPVNADEHEVHALQQAGVGLVDMHRHSKSRVSKLCQDTDERVLAFLERPLESHWPYLWLDATDLKQREGGPIVSVAAIIAMAVNTDGRREIVGLKVGSLRGPDLWSGFLKSLARRGLQGVQLVVSDAHEGLKQAIAWVLGAARSAAAWGC